MRPGLRVRPPGPLTRRAFVAALDAPGWFVVSALAVAVVAMARVGPTLIDDRAADDAFRSAVVDASPRAPWQPVTDVHAYVDGLTDPAAADGLTVAMDDLQVYGSPTVTVQPIGYRTDASDPMPVVRGPAGTAPAVIVHRTGVANAFAGVGAPAATGVWLSRPVADAIGATAGTTVWFSEPATRGSSPDPLPEAAVAVAGVYDVSDDGVFPAVPPAGVDGGWSALAPDLPDDPIDPSEVASMAFADLHTTLGVIAQLGERSLVTWDLPWQGAVDIETGRRASTAIRRLDQRLGQRNDSVGAFTADLGLGQVRVTSAVPDLVAGADEVRTAQAPLSASLATTGQVLGVVMLGAVVWLSDRARRREIELVVQSGGRLVAVGARSVLERTWAVLLGVSLGTAAAWALVSVGADGGSVSAAAWAAARRDVVVAGLVALGTVAVVSWHGAWSSPGTPTGRVHAVASAVRWEVVVAVATLATGWELRAHPDGALDTSAIVLFPVCAALTVAAVTIRVLGWAVGSLVARRDRRRRTASRSRHPVAHVLVRRFAARLREATPSLLVTTAGLALAVFAVSLDRSGSDTIAAKVDSTAGARTVVQLGWSGDLTGGETGLPDPPDGASVVWRVGSIDAGPRERFDLQAVDPGTFPRAARWHTSFGERGLQPLMALIDDELPAHVLPVIASGPGIEQLPDDGLVDEGLFQFPYRIVARLPTMPGRLDAHRGMLTVAAPLLFDRLGDQAPTVPADRADDRDGSFQTFLWSERRSSDLIAQLDSLGVDLTDGGRREVRVVSGSDLVDRTPVYVAFRTVAPFFAGIGLLTLLLGGAAPLVQVLRDRRGDAVDGVILRSMGLRGHQAALLAMATPLATAVVAVTVGVPTSLVLVRLVVPRADPASSASPGFAGTVDPSVAGTCAAAILVAATIAGLVSTRLARRATAEDLRVAE
ncbi:MAG: FtsX-like permease family protein [Acidimicrobiales bacterium]